jgi:undecaprenyl-diphosphatase
MSLSEWLHILSLALVQGFTEFLPISSSAHLILLPTLSGWTDQGLAFDIALHFGTLLAVMTYFRHDLQKLALAGLQPQPSFSQPIQRRLFWLLALAVLPLILASLMLHHWVATQLRSPLVIAYSSIFFGLVLGLADYYGRQHYDLTKLSWRGALWIGTAQAIALIPGTSRSGITLSAGLSLGLTRYSAARFSFLLAVPVMCLAMLWEAWQFTRIPPVFSWSAMFTGMGVAFLCAYLCIHYFLKYLTKFGMLPFVLYRLVLGLGLLYYFT